MATGWICHERYFWYDTGTGPLGMPSGGSLEPLRHPDHPDTKRRFRNLVEVSGLLDALVPLAPRPATEEELLRVHTGAHVARMRELSASGGGDAGDGESPFGAGSYDIARLAAGGVITAVDAVLDGAVANAYALVRPPGHHALPDRGIGFCMFGNIAVAAEHARARGLRRIAVVDWDVHHGNGTQAIFEADPGVLAVSLHQDGLFPLGSGAVDERGTGPGKGFTVNVPLPPGSGTGAYLEAFERVVEPAVRAFAPELLFVASGFDASTYDPLARMGLHSGSYRQMTERVMGLGVPVVVAHEGGYSPEYVPFCGLAVVEALAGIRTAVTDPFLEDLLAIPGQELTVHQREAVARAAAALDLEAVRSAP
ncbi:class II histone deacetylase [Actinomadura rubrisoli]|uniref:Class II histone deacetylase n=1 Tax=Actinomadura rubrisoli TaxID=2530368 RepID=A0A4R5BV52_9ACTN|nr:class II histone deacetylase [Actinomadura rubrisoli]TDD91008.1 class II histone deacetylase [Actinomadura rubrisoli]